MTPSGSEAKPMPARLVAIPAIAIVLVVVALGSLLWLTHRHELEAMRQELIGDVLWAEQNFRFHLHSDLGALAAFSRRIADDELSADDFRSSARVLLENNPELVHVAWYGADNSPFATFPGGADVNRNAQSEDATRVAKLTGDPSYSGIFRTGAREWRFEVHVPFFRDSKFAGELVGTYSLDAMMQHLVPWWHAQKYRLAVLDAAGNELTSKSNVREVENDLSYQIPIDPPGHGMLLQASRYTGETSLTPNLLIAAIALLSAAMIWSLFSLSRHMRKRVAVEQQLAAAHAFRKAMEDSMITGMRARDLKGRITYVNPAFCRMTGFSADELIGQSPPHPYWASETFEKNQDAMQRTLEGCAPAEGFELRFRRKNGEHFDALVHEAPLIDSSGNHTGWIGSIVDITERRRTAELDRQQREQLQFTSRLVAMGELASTLAHELNQPLSAITSYVTGMLNKLEDGNLQQSELKHALGVAASQAQRAGRIIRRVHEFVRRQEPRRTLCDLNRVVEDAVAFAESEAKKSKVRMELELSPDMPRIQADGVMLEQVVLNLAKNGIEAMRDVPPERRALTVRTEANGSEVAIVVRDRGPGISRDVAEKLFSPFFTTKEKGMGMGLNICRSIAEFHRGRIDFEPDPAGGSIFRFSLPC
jgi:two-component system sensor histidine kinase DctS